MHARSQSPRQPVQKLTAAQAWPMQPWQLQQLHRVENRESCCFVICVDNVLLCPSACMWPAWQGAPAFT